MIIRKRTPGERAAAFVRKLNEPRAKKRRKRVVVFVTRGDVEQIFREAAKTR